jgi:hypothetical protein
MLPFFSSIVCFALGLVVGWYAHRRYGTSLSKVEAEVQSRLDAVAKAAKE